MARARAATAAGHARSVRRGPAPRGARRVSGPARTPQRNAPLRPVVAGGGAVALPRPGARPRIRTRVGGADAGLGARLLRRLVALPDSVWLGRLLRGRLWIALIATSLIGIVFMQVSLLKLNAGIGRAVETATTLEHQNAKLRAAVSQLASNDRIQQFAQANGMVLPPAGAVTFLGREGRAVGGDAPGVAGDSAAAASTLTPPPSGIAPDPSASTTTPPAGTETATGAVTATGTAATAAAPATSATTTTAAPPAATGSGSTATPSTGATTATPPAAPATPTTAGTPTSTATPTETTTAGGGAVAAPAPQP